MKAPLETARRRPWWARMLPAPSSQASADGASAGRTSAGRASAGGAGVTGASTVTPPARTGDLDEYLLEVRGFLGPRLVPVFGGDGGRADAFAEDIPRGLALLLIADAPLGLALVRELIGAAEEELGNAADRVTALREARRRAYVRVLGIMSEQRDDDRAAVRLADELGQARDHDRTYARQLEAASVHASRLRNDPSFGPAGTRAAVRELYDTTFAAILDRPDFSGQAARHRVVCPDPRLDDPFADVRAIAEGLAGDLARIDLHAAMIASALRLDLNGAALNGADLRDLDLSEAELGDADLGGVRWSAGTAWPAQLVAQVTERSTETGPGTLLVGDG